jgi:hypothetical protein
MVDGVGAAAADAVPTPVDPAGRVQLRELVSGYGDDYFLWPFLWPFFRPRVSNWLWLNIDVSSFL